MKLRNLIIILLNMLTATLFVSCFEKKVVNSIRKDKKKEKNIKHDKDKKEKNIKHDDKDKKDKDKDNKKIAEPDSDKDQIPDKIDNCPNIPNPYQKDANKNGIGDACENFCGDGKITSGEACDPGIKRKIYCRSYGYLSGVVKCNKCRLDFSGCIRRKIKYRGGRGSCPYIYLWDGKKYVYHGDASGSVLGYGIPFFKPQYYGNNIYKLGNFKSVKGKLLLKLREVIFETSFVDKVALIAVDVPKGYDVYNLWSFTSQLNRKADLRFVTTKRLRKPISATSVDNKNVLHEVSTYDGIPLKVKPSGLSRVILDFGKIKHPKYAKLIIGSWGFYGRLKNYQKPPYSAGTTIEVMRKGKWKVVKIAGKSAGDSKLWAIDIHGLLKKNNSKIRLTMAHLPSVLDLLDFVALDDSKPVKVIIKKIFPVKAELRYGGATKIIPSTLKNRIIAEDKKLPLIKGAYMKGNFTRFGDVRSLLLKSDDMFVIMGHGDDLHLVFNDLPKRRGYVRKLFMDGDIFYSIKFHPFRKLTDSIYPLPYHGMVSYPYKKSSYPYKNDKKYKQYLKKYNTRVHK